MSALSNIPPQAVVPLGAYSLDDLTRCARNADQRLLQADLGNSRTRSEVLNKLARSFSLPKHFGHNLDALYDCVTDLQPLADASHPGFVVILQNIPENNGFDAQARNALLDVFREAAGYFFDRKTAFRVFYSVARDKARDSSRDN
jgi:RNAse (barnase) inhibitor barstar